MFGGRKTMRNRLNSPLPSFFAPAPEALLSAPRPGPHPLEVYDITYLHFHDNLELGVCVSGQGACQVEGVLYPFAAGDVQIIFPFQSHLSRSEGARQSRWFWLNIDPMRLLAAWGAPGLARLERLLHTGMGLCGIIDGARYPLIRELVARVVLSGGEQRTLRKLMQSNERKVETLNGKIEDVRASMAAADPTDFTALGDFQAQISDLQQQIDALEEEWMEAAEKLGE